MPQPKKASSTSRSKSSSARSRKTGGRSSARSASAASRRSGTTAKKSTTARKAPAKKSTTEFSGKNVADFREALRGSVLNPLNLLILSRDRIQEAMDDAVERGRMTREDATELVQGLVRQGRKQTNDVLADLEQLLGRSRSGLTGAVRSSSDRAQRELDRARRAVGVGPSFPILGYDELTAAQVQSRLDGLSPAELRKVRDYERRNANRKSVLDAVNAKLNGG